MRSQERSFSAALERSETAACVRRELTLDYCISALRRLSLPFTHLEVGILVMVHIPSDSIDAHVCDHPISELSLRPPSAIAAFLGTALVPRFHVCATGAGGSGRGGA